MPIQVRLPVLGEGVTEGTISRWLKSEGARVEEAEPLLEVSTDKVDTEVPSPGSGTLVRVLFREGETVRIGTELALIDDAPARPTTSAAPSPEPPSAATSPPASARDGDRGPTPYVTPLVRRIATELGVDLTTVRGSGIGGRIRKIDVLAMATPAPVSDRQMPTPGAVQDRGSYISPLVRLLAEQRAIDLDGIVGTGFRGRIRRVDLPGTPPTPAPGSRTRRLPRLRSIIADRMVESLRVSAQLTSVVEVDVTAVSELRRLRGPEFAACNGIKLTYTPFFALAAIEALTQFPSVNGAIDTDNRTVTYHDAVHLSVAVDTDRGLLAPVMENADTLSLVGIAKATAALAQRARAGTLGAGELSGGTFTLTNTGSRGALFDTPIINQPQVAILGTGAVVDRPVVRCSPGAGKKIEIRAMAYLALTYDHRLIDGADAARFLTAVKRHLEESDFANALER